MMRLLGLLVLLAAIAGAGVIGAAGPAYRFGEADLATALRSIMGLGATITVYAVAASLLVLVLALVARRGILLPVLALVVSGLALANPLSFGAAVRASGPLQPHLSKINPFPRVPPIHDITTDPDNPPAFVDLLAARQASPNGADYAGAKLAAAQREAYPDLAPLYLDMSADRAFAEAQAAAAAMGWDLVAAIPEEGRIEATATTLWWGFKDDVVIRVGPAAEGGRERARVDVRSMSRVGRSDIGANAARIRAYLAKLEATARG